MTFFPDTTLHRYTYTSTGTGVYGETVQGYEYSDDILVDFQHENNQELAHQYGVDLQNLYKIYTDLTTTLNDNDRLVDDEDNEYHIIGNVQRYSKFHKYQRAHLVRNRTKTISDGGT